MENFLTGFFYVFFEKKGYTSCLTAQQHAINTKPLFPIQNNFVNFAPC